MPEPAPNPAAPPIPDHELIRCVGRGSYGEVWLARNVVGTFRAVKIVQRKTFEDERPFEREFAGMQKFEPISRHHPGLVSLLHIGRAPDYFFYIMEVADDRTTGQQIDPAIYAPKTLAGELKQRGRMPLGECLEIARPLAEALGYLHERGLIHRDIKPSNIIFVQGAPKFADIGLVTDAGEKATCVGTPGYLPPEGPSSPSADLYSFGKVLYELCTGKTAEQFPELPSDLRQCGDAPQLIRLNEIILKACAPNARDRFPSAVQMLAALDKIPKPRRAARPEASSPPGPTRLDTRRERGTPTSPQQGPQSAGPTRVVILNTAGTEPAARLAEWIEERLAERGCDVFVDTETSLTLEWGRAIEIEIRQADAVIALLSAASAQNEMFAYGLELARQESRRKERAAKLLPVRVGLAGDLPPRIVQAIGPAPPLLWAGSPDDRQLADELIEFIERSPAPSRMHR